MNLNYNYIKSLDFVLIIIISPHLANNIDKIFVFFGKEIRNMIRLNIEPQYCGFSDE